MTEHTPGPWKAEGTCPQEGWDGWWVKDAEGNHIAEATGYQADETRQANARLIAAAPVMYDYIKIRAEEGDERAEEIMRLLS